MDNENLFLIFLTVFMLILAAIFSAAESSYLAISRSRLQMMIKEKRKHAKLAQKLYQMLENVVGTLLLAISFTTIVISILMTRILTPIFGDAVDWYSTLITTVIVVIFSDALPKFYAIRKAEGFALTIAPSLAIFIKIMKPFTYFVEYSARLILRIFGVKDPNPTLAQSLEELRGAIDLHHGEVKESRESQDSRAMLHSILDLNDVSLEDVLIHRSDVKMLNLDDPIAVIHEQIITSPHTRLPLWQGTQENVVGILHTKNFLKLAREKKDDIDHDDILAVSRKPWYVPESATLYEQLQAFRRRREHMALVVDEYGDFQGVVTLEDIIEEIVGRIDDEHDPNMNEIWQTSGGEVYAVGTATIRDINRQYEWELPDEEAATIAGLLLYEVRAIPEVNQIFDIAGYRIQVMRRSKNQITLVKISPHASLGGGSDDSNRTHP